jgi:hypothetical protein
MTSSSTLAIDTGMPRNVTGHVISGALAAGALAGAINYDKYKKNEMSRNKAVRNTIQLSVQGGIATGSAVAAANYVGQGKIFTALTAVSLGVMGIYATKQISEKISELTLSEDEEKEILLQTTGEE